mmetsp:Transcript_187/g.264  ORF Transcript_187/g.264 Transcript_187/m.264 type:complete len:223 (-) Transcript_187:109-777(-)
MSGFAFIAAQAREARSVRSETSNQRRKTAGSVGPARSIRAWAGSSAPRVSSMSSRARNNSDPSAGAPRGASSSASASICVKLCIAGKPCTGCARINSASVSMSDAPQSPAGRPVIVLGKSPTASSCTESRGCTEIAGTDALLAILAWGRVIVSESQSGSPRGGKPPVSLSCATARLARRQAPAKRLTPLIHIQINRLRDRLDIRLHQPRIGVTHQRHRADKK